ncbi:WXG100 family type VII secretion target [Actinoplanes sp. NPDC000266]
MTMPGFQLTPELIKKASLDSYATADSVWQHLAELRNYVLELEQTWQGVAQNTFQQLMTDFDIYARMMNDALRDIGQGLDGNYVNYLDTEQQNIANLKPVSGQLMPGQTGFDLPPSRF